VPAGWTAVTRGWRRRANSFLGGIVGKASRRHHERRPGPPRGRRQRLWKQGRQGVATAATEARKARRPADRQGEHRDPGNTVSTGRREARVPRGTLRRSDPPPPLRTAPTGAPPPPPEGNDDQVNPLAGDRAGVEVFRGDGVDDGKIEAAARTRPSPARGRDSRRSRQGGARQSGMRRHLRSSPPIHGPHPDRFAVCPSPGRGGTSSTDRPPTAHCPTAPNRSIPAPSALHRRRGALAGALGEDAGTDPRRRDRTSRRARSVTERRRTPTKKPRKRR
jgi:hypothetical protein